MRPEKTLLIILICEDADTDVRQYRPVPSTHQYICQAVMITWLISSTYDKIVHITSLDEVFYCQHVTPRLSELINCNVL